MNTGANFELLFLALAGTHYYVYPFTVRGRCDPSQIRHN